jgi:hypothetical protein
MIRKPSPSKFVALLLLMVCLAAAGALILKSRMRDRLVPSTTSPHESTTVDNSTADNSTASPQVASDSVPLQAELVTLRPTGFEPAQIKPAKGRFLLVVNNHSELPGVELRLQRDTGSRLRAVRVTQEQLHWSDVMNLPPGRYVLTEANHPDWVCRIIVASH